MNANESGTDESIGLELTVCENGVINVLNHEGEHDAHSIVLNDSGEIEQCSCPGWTFYQTCYHVDEVRDRPLILSSAQALNQSHQSVATDGGHNIDDRFRLPEDPKHVSEDDLSSSDSHGVVDVGRCVRCDNYVYGDDDYCSERCREKGPVNDIPL